MSVSFVLQSQMCLSTQRLPLQHPTKFICLMKAEKNINMNFQDPSLPLVSNGIPQAPYWQSDGTMVKYFSKTIGRITIWN